MFHRKNTHEAYWNSYRLLESQLLRLSHSVCFDDEQINVYSPELADIINSACIKIESLSKDIYEEHIWPFQFDDDIVPISYTDSKPKKPASKFLAKKWTREKWKYDYNCLVEIDSKFALSKKRVELKTEKFEFLKYGSTILPFGNISVNECNGGYWEHSDRNPWHEDTHKLEKVDWCKSYQAIKHNYIQSIPEHGTIKNAVMVLSAFYLLAVYNSCLPFRQFTLENKSKYQLDFGSELFSCSMCNYTIPPCIVDSERIKWESERAKLIDCSAHRNVLIEQEVLNNVEGFPFLITLSLDAYNEVNKLVKQYQGNKDLGRFDIAPYQKEGGLMVMDVGAALYLNLKKYIIAPYRQSNVCITFNTGTERVYDDFLIDHFEYEKSKYKKHTTAVLETLQIGDVVDAKFIFDECITKANVVKITEHTLDLSVEINDEPHITSQPKDNIIYIRKVR